MNSKNIRLMSMSLLIFCLLHTVLGAAANTTLNSADYASPGEAFAAIPEDAGEVTILLSGQYESEEEILEIPADRGITELKMIPAEDAESFTAYGIGRICANGVPLTIGEGVDLPNTSIYGGACVSGTEASLESSSLQILGNAGFVFGGGFAENGGLSSVAEPSVVTGENSLIYFEVFGGGHAYGKGSRVTSEKPSVTVLGTTDYVLGAGFGEDGGTSECSAAEVTVGENASVEVALFAGGSAAGAGSLSVTGNPLVHLSGAAHWVFSGDFAFDGGETRISGSGRLEILPSGRAVDAFLGSFASDPGSTAFINTAELENCGTVELIYERGQSADGGTDRTTVTANFPCSLAGNK